LIIAKRAGQLATIAILTGCATLSPLRSIEPRSAAGIQGPLGSAADQTTGTVLVAVKWPTRGATYRGQVIPESANSIRLRVLPAGGSPEIAPTLLIRPSGGSLISTASIEVAAAQNLTVEAKAYRLSVPGDSSTPIATASVSGVNVLPSTETAVALILAPASPPSISGFSPPNAGPGALVTFTGINFLEGGAAVKFASNQSAQVGTVTATTLVAAVPASASNGPVQITIDGITATSSAFTVLGELTLSPATTSTNATGSPIVFALSGKDHLLKSIQGATASVTFGILAPLDGGASASMSGLSFTPLTAGSFEIRATSGTLT